MRIKLISILASSTLLLSCSSTPNITVEGNKTIERENFFKTTTIKPTRIIKNGLGMSFTTSIENVKKENFISMETNTNGKRKRIGEWIKFMKKDDFWRNKEITILPKNKTASVSWFGASKYYYDNGASVESACKSDFYLISKALKEKYPELIRIVRVEGVHFLHQNVKGRADLLLAEGQKEQMVYLDGAYSTNRALGRSISLDCIPFGKKGKTKSRYALELKYNEDFEVLYPERSDADEKVLRSNRLKDRKIDIKEL
jgi:hypothetical protein